MIDTTVFQDKTAVYYTLGCKLNFSETSTIGQILKEAGVRTARRGEKADICVVNTCSVTEVADKKCRQAIHRLIKNHPGAFVVVTGCYAQLKPEQIAAIEGVDDSILLFTGGFWGDHDGFRTGFRGKETDTILVCQHILYGVFPTQYPLTGTYQGTVLLLVL